MAIGWRGGVRHTRKSARTIGLDLWQPLFKRDDIAIINLQYDSDQDERDFIQANGGFTPAFDLKNDMDDLAAFLGAIDLFISAEAKQSRHSPGCCCLIKRMLWYQ